MKMRVGVLCAAVGTAGMLAGVSCKKEKTAIPAEVIRPVVTMTVQAPGAGRERAFSGAAKASLYTPLSFRVAGTIAELPAKVGLKVRTGDLIARLDVKDYELQSKQSQAQFEQADAQLAQAKANYERVRQLYEAKNVSKSELDSVEAGFKSGTAQKESAAKALELARQQLSYCILKAPVDGSLAEVPVEMHQTVAAGQAIALLSSGDELEVEVGIPEAIIGRIKVGDMANVKFEAIPDRVFKAAVSQVGIQMSASTTYLVKLRLQEKDSRIRIGMVAETTFSFGAGENAAILVPAVAVSPTPDGKRFVWVFKPEASAVTKRMVKIGDLTSGGLEILDGLAPGEIIVTRGVNRMSEGMKVKLLAN